MMYKDVLREVLNRVYRNTDDCDVKPVKVALDSAVMVVGDARSAIDVSAATLTDMVESVKTVNDKLYEIAYKDGNLEMKEIK